MIARLTKEARGKSGQHRTRQPLTAAGVNPRKVPQKLNRRLKLIWATDGKGEMSEVRAHSDVR